MKKFKGESLVIDNIYQDREGIYIYKGKQNQLYLFDEIYINEDEDIEIVQEIKRTADELYFED